MSSSREFEPSTGNLSAEDVDRVASEPDPGDEPTRFVAPASPASESNGPRHAAPEAETQPEPEPEWLAPPPKKRRRTGAFTVAFTAAVLVIIGTLVAVAYVTSRGDHHPVVAAPESSSASSGPSSPSSTVSGRPPAGADAVVESAQTIMDGFNRRDVKLLQSVSCSQTNITDDVFAGIGPNVEYEVDGKARIAGSTAKIHYVAVDKKSGNSNGGDMSMEWDGNRWCFASAGQ